MRSIRSLLLLTLAAVALVGCARRGKTTLPSALQDDLAKLPQEVQSVFYADVQSLQNSKLGKEFRKEFDSEMQKHRHHEDYKEFIEATGFDLQKDLHSALVGMQVTRDANGDSAGHMHGAVFAILKGAFDESKIVSHIQAKQQEKGKEEMVVATYNGKTIYTGPRGRYAAYFAEANTLVVGTQDWVKMIIDNKLEGKNLLANGALMNLIHQLPHKDQLWAVGIPGELMERITSELSKHEDFKGGHALRSLQSGMLSARVNAAANLWASASCSNEEDSRLMSDALKGVLAMAKLAVSDDRELVDMLNRFEIKAKGTEVHMAAKIDKAFFEKMREKRAVRKVATL